MFIMDNCCTCFDYGTELLCINEACIYGDITIRNLLGIILPEVEWLENFGICQKCKDNLILIYIFRQQCLTAHTLRDQTLKHNREDVIMFEVVEPKIEIKQPHLGETNNDNVKVKPKINRVKERKVKTNSKFVYRCSNCPTAFPRIKLLIEHCRESHDMEAGDVRPYYCHECKKGWRLWTGLFRHQEAQHKTIKNLLCPYCGKAFKSHAGLRQHEAIHKNLRKYQCELCAKRFNTLKNLISHKTHVHTEPNQWKYVCGKCPRRFPLKSALNIHLSRHENLRLYRCRECHKSFNSRKQLRTHRLGHEELNDSINENRTIKLHKCELCEKEYKHKAMLLLHQNRIHKLGDYKEVIKKNFLCSVCLKRFRSSADIKRHMCTHTGDKPFSCPLCDKRFTDKRLVTRHFRSAHYEEIGENTRN